MHDKLSANPLSVSDRDVDDCVESMLPQSYTVDMPLSQAHFYRARFNTGFGDTEINEFSYNHNFENIRMQRMNMVGEPVLYTSTFPSVALNEIRNGNQYERFYLSVWQTKYAGNVKCAINVTTENLSGTAKKYQDTIKNKQWDSQAYEYLSAIGNLLEMPGTDYRASSKIASKLFKSNDAIVTVSQKSNGQELNFTFTKDIADDKLELKYVFDCDVPLTETLSFRVHRIGIPNGNHVIWNNWTVNIDSVEYNPRMNRCSIPVEELRELLTNNNNLLKCLQPNVNKAPDSEHDGVFDISESRFYVKFKINLSEI